MSTMSDLIELEFVWDKPHRYGRFGNCQKGKIVEATTREAEIMLATKFWAKPSRSNEEVEENVNE